VKKHHRGKSGKDEAQAGKRPEEADITFGHENEQTGEKQRLKKYTSENVRAGGADFDHARDFRGADFFNIADIRHALFQEHNSGRLKSEPDQKYQ